MQICSLRAYWNKVRVNLPAVPAVLSQSMVCLTTTALGSNTNEPADAALLYIRTAVSQVNHDTIRRGGQLSVNMKEKLAYRMRTARKYLDEAYLKIFPTDIGNQEPAPAKEIVVQPVSENTPVERQNKRIKKFYEKSKEKVLAQQKEYQGQKPLYEKARARMLYYLNSDPDYHNKKRPNPQRPLFGNAVDRHCLLRLIFGSVLLRERDRQNESSRAMDVQNPKVDVQNPNVEHPKTG
jgi:hypothetical protein